MPNDIESRKSSKRRRTLESLGQWVLDDFALQTRDNRGAPVENDVVFCNASSFRSDRNVSMVSMYLRQLEHAERLGLMPLRTSDTVREWLSTGFFKRAK